MAVVVGHRIGAILAIGILPAGAVPWWDFALPIPPVFAVVRSSAGLSCGEVLLRWLNLQTRFDLEAQKDHLGTSLETIRPLRSA